MRTTTSNERTSYFIDQNLAFTLFFTEPEPIGINSLDFNFTPNSTDDVGGKRNLILSISN